MKKALVVCWVVLLVSFVCLGCSATHKAITYYEACKGDTECMAKMEENASKASVITENAVAVFPTSNKAASVLGLIAGNLASLLSGIIYGRKVCKKKEV